LYIFTSQKYNLGIGDVMKYEKVLRALAPIIAGLIILAIPTPESLTFKAWCYFALFIAVIVALITRPLPDAVVGLIGISLAAVFCLVEETPKASIKWALSGFANTTVWLIFAAFMFALGYSKTGLGRRIALHLIRKLGRNTLGLGYAVALSDLVLAPFMPSNTARSAGTIYPIIRNIPEVYGSYPGETAGKIGTYIMWVAFATTCVTSSMFLTSLAPNPLAAAIVAETVNIELSWLDWVIGFLPVGIILFILVPFITFKLAPPEIKRSDEIVKKAEEMLKEMGPIKRNEIIFLGLVLFALVLWIGGRSFIHTTTVAVLIVVLMLLFKIISWDDILEYKQAWNVLVWFATLVTLASGLKEVGIIEWIANSVSASLSGISPILVIIIIFTVFYFMHYLFASITAHTVAMLPVFLAVFLAIPDIPIKVATLMLCYSLGLFGILTPYATGPAPVYYGSGYIPPRKFWLLGLIYGLIFYFALLIIGLPYLLLIAS